MRIVVTRPESQARELVEGLRRLGAEPILYPVLRFEPLALEELPESPDWWVFTSANAVDFLLKSRRPQGGRIAAIGEATARALERWNLKADLIPSTFVAEGLLEALPADLRGVRIVIPRALEAREVLPEELKKRGAEVRVLPVYRTVPAEQPPLQEKADWIVFTSSSTVKNFVQLSGVRDCRVIAIGPVTAQAARQAGFRSVVQADEFTTEGILRKLQKTEQK